MRENGGSRITLCGEKTHRSRTSLATTKDSPSTVKNRLRRAGETFSSNGSG